MLLMKTVIQAIRTFLRRRYVLKYLICCVLVLFTNCKVHPCAVYVYEISNNISILCGICEKDQQDAHIFLVIYFT
jgi:hypothetical protein